MNETLNISDAVLEKIQKLLRLGQSDNPYESELALLHAKRLAATHDVDITLIEIFGRGGSSQKEPIIKNNGISLGQRKSVTQIYVSWLLERHFSVKVIYSGNREYGRTMYLIGTKEKLEIAEFVQVFLNKTFMNLWHDYFNKTNCPLNFRNSYLLGLHNGLSDKLDKEQEQVVTEKLATHTEETRNKFSLMVVNEKERLKEAVNSFFPKLRRVTSYQAKSYSSNAINDGIQAGGQINIRKTIGNNCGDRQLVS